MTATISAPQDKMTAEEYLKMQRSGPREVTGKYEFINQKLIFMAGASPNHNRITRNLTTKLDNQIVAHGTNQELFANELRTVSYSPNKNYLYPDIVVVDGVPYFDDENGDNLANPTLIIEVLSKTTEGIDRGDKFKSYRQTPSIKEYLLVSQKEKSIEQFYKDENGRWQIGDIFTEGTFKLQTLPFELSVEDVYRNVDLSKIDPSEMDIEEERKG